MTWLTQMTQPSFNPDSHYFKYFEIVVKGSCTRVIRRNASVIRVGVAYTNVCILRCLKEELSWAINEWLRLIVYAVLLKTVIPLRI